MSPILDEPTARVCAQIASGALAPVRLAVVAPAGYGKTTLLAVLRAQCAAAGSAAVPFGAEVPADGPVLVLVDDAHRLPCDALTGLAALAADPRVGLVVTARPGPRPDALTDVLTALRGQLVLRPLDRSGVARVLGPAAAGELTDYVLAQTGGVPGLVAQLAGAVNPTAGEPGRLPEAALTGARHELDTADPDAVAFLLAAQAGVAGDVDLLRTVLSREPDEVAGLARATGLLTADGTVLPLGAAALDSFISEQRRTALHGSLAEAQLDRGGPVLDLIGPLAASGAGGAALAEAFEAGAREAMASDPALAVLLFDAAVTAGRPADGLLADWAAAALRSGDLDGALRLSEKAIGGPDDAARVAGVQVAAAAMAARGQLAASTELLRRAGTGVATGFAAIGLLGTGQVAHARAALAADDQDNSLLSGAIRGAAQAIVGSVHGLPTTALSIVVSSAELVGAVAPTVVLPDSPAALAAIMAVHCGEPSVVDAVVQRALTEGAPFAERLALLRQWPLMLRGDRVEPATEDGALELRDQLFALALRLGVARRASDQPAMRRVWGLAGEVIIRHPVDLYTLLPLGEFAIAAARLGDRDRVRPHLDAALRLLRDLGDPPLWSAPLRWSVLHAAIVAGAHDEAREHADALTAAAATGPCHAALAAGAEAWLAVLAGRIDPDEVEAAARSLHGAGLCWDGARLAGQAAIRTTDRKAMVRLLECARALHDGAEPGTPDTAEQGGTGVRLSDREVQVAELVVAGMTYKQVGDQLFISAKTVEHHMARMRQRIGATSRSDLLSQLRELIAR